MLSHPLANFVQTNKNSGGREMNTAKKIENSQPLLTSLKGGKATTRKKLRLHNEFRKERKRMEEVYALLGWSDLPEVLKNVIAADVKGYADELEGRYSTRCEYVQRRRESIDFWVRSYKDGLCSVEAASDALMMTV